MKTVYKCEYCETCAKEKTLIEKHEEKCGYNPKNKITDKVVLKLSRINEDFIDSLMYVLIEDFNNDLKFYNNEFERATRTNCPASIYENKGDMTNILYRCKVMQNDKDNFKYFKEINKRDNSELIQAIRTYLKYEVK